MNLRGWMSQYSLLFLIINNILLYQGVEYVFHFQILKNLDMLKINKDNYVHNIATRVASLFNFLMYMYEIQEYDVK